MWFCKQKPSKAKRYLSWKDPMIWKRSWGVIGG